MLCVWGKGEAQEGTAQAQVKRQGDRAPQEAVTARQQHLSAAEADESVTLVHLTAALRCSVVTTGRLGEMVMWLLGPEKQILSLRKGREAAHSGSLDHHGKEDLRRRPWNERTEGEMI